METVSSLFVAIDWMIETDFVAPALPDVPAWWSILASIQSASPVS